MSVRQNLPGDLRYSLMTYMLDQSRIFHKLLPLSALFLSGFAALIYEIVWQRVLVRFLGGSFSSVSLIVCIFLGGMAIGAILCSITQNRNLIQSPLKTWAKLEMLLSMCGFGSVFLANPNGWNYICSYTSTNPAINTAIAIFLLLIPTICMGATLPVAIHYFSQMEEANNKSATISTYAVNTTGGLVGALCCAFAILPWAGISTTLTIATAINFNIAAYLSFMVSISKTAAPQEVEEASQSFETSPVKSPLLNQLAFISGFSIIILEVAWTRYFNLLGGSNTYMFSLVLVFTLAGLSIAAWLVRDASKRFMSNLPSPFPALTALATLSALSVTASIYALNIFPEHYHSLLSQMQKDFPSLGFFQSKIAIIALCMNVVILLPCTICGTIFPLILSLDQKSNSSSLVSKRAASLLALNTGGCVFGYVTLHTLFYSDRSFAGGSIIETCFLLVAATFFVYAIVLFFMQRKTQANRLNIACLLLVLLVVPGIIFKPHWPAAALTQSNKDSMRFYKEGPNSVVSVDASHGLIRLKTNGKVEGSLPDPVPSDFPPIYSDMPTQVLLGLIPASFTNSKASKGLVIGMGTGTTCGTALQVPTVKECTVVEIEPAVYEASKFFASSNHSPWDSSKFKLKIADARNYLAASKEKYDWITSQPGEPSNSGSADLYTREFFQLVKSRLTSDGIFAQWIQLYGISANDLKSLIGTFYEVFPKGFIFQARGAGEIILVATDQSFLESSVHCDQLLLDKKVADIYFSIGMRNWLDLMADIISDAPKNLKDFRINTDDNLKVELSSAKSVQPTEEQINKVETTLRSICNLPDAYSIPGIPNYRIMRSIPLYTCASDAIYLEGLEPETLDMKRILNQTPNQFGLVWFSQLIKDKNFTELSKAVTPTKVISPFDLTGSALCNFKLGKDPQKCLSILEKSLEINPLQYIANFHAAKCHYNLGNIQDALYRMKLASQIYPVSNLPHIWVCAVLVKDGQLDLAKQNLELLKKRSLKTAEEKSRLEALKLSIENKSTPATDKIIDQILQP